MSVAGQGYHLQINQRGRVRCEPGWHLGRGWSRGLRDFDLWFVWEGRGHMQIGEHELVLRPGVCVWMRPGGRYEAEQDMVERLGVNYIHFSLLSRDHHLPLSAFEPPFEMMRTQQVGFIDGLMRHIIGLGTEAAASRSAVALLGGLLAELEREFLVTSHQPPPGTDQRHRDIILRTAARIRESPAQAPTVTALAREMGYSVDHFSRIFLKVTGQRPQDYIVRARIERARHLLAESDLTVGMVAEALGFQDIFYFSRQFRRKTGQTPTEFRRGLRVQ